MPSWPADKVERRPVASLVPYARNARTHSDEQVAQIAASIREWGWTTPVLVDEEGGLIAGHGRVLAARQLGVTEVPVMVATGWTAAQKKAYIIADNQLPMNAGWDKELLRLEVADLAEMGFDLPLIGFSEDELTRLSASGNAGLTDPDDAPEAPADPVSVLGDVWVMGKHRLVCGDCTNAADVVLAVGGAKIDAVITDPPYGVGVEYATFTDTEQNTKDVVEDFMPLVQAMGCPIALTPGVPVMWRYPQPAWVMVWVHPAPTGGCAWGFSGVNPILVYGKDPYLSRGLGRRPDHVVLAAGREGVEGHPTPKPIKVWLWLVERLTTGAEQVVFEPFSGSGTTIIACETLGRSCRGIEISPAYVDVAVRRWEAFTGQHARIDETGETFAEVAERRRPGQLTTANAA